MTWLYRALLVVHVAWYALLWGSLVTSPAVKGMDFLIFFTAARVAQRWTSRGLYDPVYQSRVQCEITDVACTKEGLLPFNHPPFLLPLLKVVVSDNYVASYVRWSVVLTVCLSVSVSLLTATARQIGVPTKQLPFLALSIGLYYPVFMSLLKGQDTAWLLLGLALFSYAFSRELPFVAGAGLSLTCIRPHLALLFALPFCFARRKVWWGFFIGAGVLVFSSIAIVGFAGVRDYIEMLTISATSADYVINQSSMYNLAGLLLRVLPSEFDQAVVVASWAAYGLGLVGLLLLWYKGRDSIGLTHFALVVVLSTFLAPHLHFHDLAILALPWAIVVTRQPLRSDGLRQRSSGLILVSSAALLGADLLSGPWSHLTTYGTAIWLLFTLGRELSHRSTSSRTCSPEVADGKNPIPFPAPGVDTKQD